MPSRAIISSRKLLNALRTCPTGEPVSFQVVAMEPGISVGGTPIGGTCTGFDDFDLPADKAQHLLSVLKSIPEQPIAISYNGNWLTLHEVII